MPLSLEAFERAVANDWTRAVTEAAHLFPETRDALYHALDSDDARLRSAAVAALNEANDATAHDLIVRLVNDPDQVVRSEVLEYIEQFPALADVPVLIASLLNQESCLMTSLALARLSGKSGPVLDDDSTLVERQSAMEYWCALLDPGASNNAA